MTHTQMMLFKILGVASISILKSGILLSRKPPQSQGKRLVFQRTMVEKNGESTPTIMWGLIKRSDEHGNHEGIHQKNNMLSTIWNKLFMAIVMAGILINPHVRLRIAVPMQLLIGGLLEEKKAGPGKWNKPQLNQGPLFFKQTNQKGRLCL